MAQIYEFKPDDAWSIMRAISDSFKQHGDELIANTCPYCHGGKNRDKKSFAINLKTGQFNCKRSSCNAHGNMITLAKDFDYSLGRNVDEYHQIRPGRFRTINKTLSPEDVTDNAITYLLSRDIPAEITKQYRITTQKAQPEILVFPFYEPDGKTISFVKYRNPHPAEGQSKEWCEANCKPILFGMDHCDPSDGTLIITEGQIDTLSVATAGYRNCVSVPTGKYGFTWLPHCWDWLQQFKRLIVFGDHEHGEITLLEPMAAHFNGQVCHVRIEDYRDCKDANDILRKYGIDGIKQCIEHAEIVPDPSVSPLWMVKDKDMTMIPHFSSGFPNLDKVTGGFFRGHLYVLTGERGKGKSTLASQFAARSLRNGETIYIYSGEMPAYMVKQWIDRQLSAGNGIESYEINGRQDYRLTAAETQVINRFYEGRAFVYCADTLPPDSSEIKGVIQSAETAASQYGCTFLVIDNLMTAIDNPGPDLNSTQTTLVNELAKMARRYEVCIMLLVHPKKTNVTGKELSNDDVMGSGNITNLASVVMTYSDPPDQFNRPDRILTVTKNRLFGELATSTKAIPLWYDQATKRISAVKDDFAWPDDEQPIFTPIGEPDKELPF